MTQDHASPSVAAAAASSRSLDTPAGVSVSPLSSCGSTACVHGLSPGARPCDIRHCNTRMAPRENHKAARNSPAEHTADAEKIFCCVTTRRQAKPVRPAAWECAGGDPVRPQRVSDGPPAPPAALVAASWPASDARPDGKQGRDNIAGSTAVPDRAGRSLWQGKFAIPVAPPWSNHPHRCYAVHDPWEVLAPLGQPGEDVCASSSGTYPLVLCSVLNHRLATPPPTPCPSTKSEGHQKGGYHAPH
jgi:hypothetical protein